MRTRAAFSIGTICSLASFAAMAAEQRPTRVDVFTNDSYVITGADTLRQQHIPLTIRNVDDVKRLEQTFSQQLPADPAEAKQRAKTLLNQQSSWTREIGAAWAAILQAQKWELTQLPAMVFDNGQSVIYGQTDLQAALIQWSTWKKRGHHADHQNP